MGRRLEHVSWVSTKCKHTGWPFHDPCFVWSGAFQLCKLKDGQFSAIRHSTGHVRNLGYQVSHTTMLFMNHDDEEAYFTFFRDGVGEVRIRCKNLFKYPTGRQVLPDLITEL